jgi:hypothetical protein
MSPFPPCVHEGGKGLVPVREIDVASPAVYSSVRTPGRYGSSP